MSETKEQIMEEIVNGGWGFYNNFFQKLPDGLYEREYVPQMGRDYSLGAQNNASELYRSQTLGQFLNTIKEVILEVGGEDLVKKIGDLTKKLNTPLSWEDKQSCISEMYKVVEPVYIALRLKGYWQHDLTG